MFGVTPHGVKKMCALVGMCVKTAGRWAVWNQRPYDVKQTPLGQV